MKCDRAESLCTSLSPLLKNTIREKILKIKEPVEEYNFGQALVFWLADWISGVKLIKPEQLRTVLEEFVDRVLEFGEKLQDMWKDPALREYKKLPVCKIGFLDRRYICMDGRQFMLDLQTGKREDILDTWPLETIAYNMTTLFLRYYNQPLTKR